MQDDKIFLLRDGSPKIIMENASEEKLLNIGAVIVCQNISKEDTLQDTEKGYYESFIWKKGIGLWEYRSGYGARREHMEIFLPILKNYSMIKQAAC